MWTCKIGREDGRTEPQAYSLLLHLSHQATSTKAIPDEPWGCQHQIQGDVWLPGAPAETGHCWIGLGLGPPSWIQACCLLALLGDGKDKAAAMPTAYRHRSHGVCTGERVVCRDRVVCIDLELPQRHVCCWVGLTLGPTGWPPTWSFCGYLSSWKTKSAWQQCAGYKH